MVHHYSSAYRSSSNGLAKRGARSIKYVLKKTKILNPEVLKELLFNINSHSQGEEGSNNARFYRRSPRTRLPNSVQRQIEHRDMVRLRHSKQEKLARCKGRSSHEVFEEDDIV